VTERNGPSDLVFIGPEASTVVLGPVGGVAFVVLVVGWDCPVVGVAVAACTWLVTTAVPGEVVPIGAPGTEVSPGPVLVVTVGVVVVAATGMVVTAAGAVVDELGPLVVGVATTVVGAVAGAVDAVVVVVVVGFFARGCAVVVVVCCGVVVVGLGDGTVGDGAGEVVVVEVPAPPAEASGTACASLEPADVPLLSTAATLK
jgi:hypothetical protein